MPELDVVDQLARYGEAAEAAVDAAMRAQDPRPLADRRRPKGLWAAVAAVVAVGLFATTLAPDRRDADTAALQPGDWAVIPAAPVPAVEPQQIAATDTELLVWSGQLGGSGSRIAALSFADRSWRRIQPFPLAPRFDPVTVWTGKELVVWGGHDRILRTDGAAYDPATDSWRVLPEAGRTATRQDTGVTWTGSEAVFVGLPSWPGVEAASDAVALDPEAGTWRMLPRSPWSAEHRDVVATWTGTEVLVTSIPDELGPVAVDRLRLDGERWLDTVPTDVEGDDVGTEDVAWTGDRLVIARQGADGVIVDPESGEVAELPSSGDEADDPAQPDLPAVALDGLVVSGEHYLDVESLSWHRMPPAPRSIDRTGVLAVAHDGRLYVWGGRTCPGYRSCRPGSGVLVDGLIWAPPD